jgi:hypothetical protein
MALGSSSPEILLSVIEICGNNFLAGDLGPGTIVGKFIRHALNFQKNFFFESFDFFQQKKINKQAQQPTTC